MPSSLRPLTEMPEPQFIMSAEGHRIATYSWGDADAPTVLCVHGFASSCLDNWVRAAWVRDLERAGLRVLGVDLRGHGASDKPYEASAYSMEALVGDLLTVLDTHLVDVARYAGYSLGARIGWQLAVQDPERVERAVLGGIPDGTPLGRIDLDQARAFADRGEAVSDDGTRAYLGLAERVRGNDLHALVALAEGMRLGDLDPDPGRPPAQPVLFGTGTADPILERSRALAASAPAGRFLEVPGRDHVNTPGARAFRQPAVEFLARE